MSGQDLSLLRGVPTITVNSSCYALPDAEFAYFHDHAWWAEYGNRERFWRECSSVLVTGSRSTVIAAPAGRAALHLVRTRRCPEGRNGPRSGVEERRTHVCGIDSGTQALNLAYHLGGNPVLLVGFDMRREEGTGRAHHHPDHVDSRGQPHAPSDGSFKRFLEQYDRVAAFYRERGVVVLNCSLSSAITQFRKVTLEEAVASARTRFAVAGQPPRPRLLVAFDRDLTVDISDGPVPLEWVRRLGRHPEVSAWATGNQLLRAEAGIPGLEELVAELLEAGHPVPDKWRARPEAIPREKRVRLLDRLYPAAERRVVVDDFDLSAEAAARGWEYYAPEDFVRHVEASVRWSLWLEPEPSSP